MIVYHIWYVMSSVMKKLVFLTKTCYNIEKERVKMDEKEKQNNISEQTAEKPEFIDRTWVDDMKQELEDYIEEQGIYIRQ